MLQTGKVIGGLIVLCVLAKGQNQWQFGDSQYDTSCCEEYCYAADEEPYSNFATKTAYVNVKRRSGSQHIVADCMPIQFWSIIRHGTRLPNANKITRLANLQKLHEEVTRNYEQRRSYPDRGRLCKEDYDLFRRWHWNSTITPDKEKSLTSQGVEDMVLLARRYKTKYPQLLQQSYDERSFYFQYTTSTSEKTQSSYQAYIDGLFGSDAFRVHANTFNDDRLVRCVFASSDCGLDRVKIICRQLELVAQSPDIQATTVSFQYPRAKSALQRSSGQPYENCKKWEESENDISNKNEYKRFVERAEYKQMERDIFSRLGFRYNLNSSIVEDIYDMCRYEHAWNLQQRSPWCVAFTKNHLKLLEYAEDLKYYYTTGYGNKITEKIGCSPLKDFYERFEKTINGQSDDNKATFLFTSSGTIQALLTSLGVGKDYTPLNADNYFQQAGRNWKTSILDPFASNLAIALYQCTRNEQYRVMFFLNEVPVEFPDCSVGLCSWSTVQQKFKTIVDNCNIENFCNGNAASIRYLSYAVVAFAASFAFYFRV